MRKECVIRKLKRDRKRTGIHIRTWFNKKVTSAPKCGQLSLGARNLLTRLSIEALFNQLHSLIWLRRRCTKFLLKSGLIGFWEEKNDHLFPGNHSVIRSRITACIKYAERRNIWYDTRELSLNTPADDGDGLFGFNKEIFVFFLYSYRSLTLFN